jgi:hypothetical protein
MKILQTFGVIYLLLIISGNWGIAQESAIRDPLAHDIRTFNNTQGQLYINQHQSYQLFFSGDIDNQQVILPFQDERTAFVLPEGETQFQVQKADGTVLSVPIIVDGSAPSSSIYLQTAPQYQSGERLYIGKGLTVDLNAADNFSGVQQSYWAINNNPFNPFTVENTQFDTEGAYLLYYYSVDQVGNIEEVQLESFEIDLTGPTVSHFLEGAQQFSVVAPNSSISLTTTDESSGNYQTYFWFDDQAPQLYSTTISLSTLGDGEHTLYAYGVDQVENIGDTLAYTFYLDRNAPEIITEIVGEQFDQSGTTYIAASSRVSLSSEDNKSGTSWIRYSINQDNERTYVQPISVPQVSGSYTITYTVGDAVGNISDRQSIKVYVDNNHPETNARFDGYYSKTVDGYAVDGATLISLDANDLESGIAFIQYRMNSENWTSYSEPLSFSELGTYSIAFQAIDQVGNTEEIQTLEITVIDPSTITASNSAPEKPTSENIDFIKNGADIEGPHTEIYLWISSSDADTSSKMLLTLSDSGTEFPLLLASNKESVLQVSVEENRTNYAITIDGSAPQSSIEASDAQSYNNESSLIFAPGVTLTLSAEDNITGVRTIFASENGGRYQPYESPLRGYYSEQAYNIRFYAEDEVGNSEAEQNFSFQVDATPPITTHRFLENYSGANVSGFTQLSFSADDNMSGVNATFIQLNDQEPVLYTSPVRLGELGTYTEPFNTITYYSVDNVGNIEKSKQLNFKIDQSGPTSTLTWIGEAFDNGNVVYINQNTRFSLSAEDTEMEIRENWYQFNSGSRTIFENAVSLADYQRVTLRYGALDILGNEGEVLQSTIIVDGTAPTSSHQLRGDTIESVSDVVVGANANIQLFANDDASGISNILYSINSENMLFYDSNPIQFQSSGSKVIRYYALDKVGNIEAVNLINLVYDQTAPEVDLSFSSEPYSQSESSVSISSSTLITIKSIDRHTEVKSIEYKIGDEEFSTYLTPIILNRTGNYQLTIRAEDLLGNSISKTTTIEVR